MYTSIVDQVSCRFGHHFTHLGKTSNTYGAVSQSECEWFDLCTDSPCRLGLKSYKPCITKAVPQKRIFRQSSKHLTLRLILLVKHIDLLNFDQMELTLIHQESRNYSVFPCMTYYSLEALTTTLDTLEDLPTNYKVDAFCRSHE